MHAALFCVSDGATTTPGDVWHVTDDKLPPLVDGLLAKMRGGVVLLLLFCVALLPPQKVLLFNWVHLMYLSNSYLDV